MEQQWSLKPQMKIQDILGVNCTELQCLFSNLVKIKFFCDNWFIFLCWKQFWSLLAFYSKLIGQSSLVKKCYVFRLWIRSRNKKRWRPNTCATPSHRMSLWALGKITLCQNDKPWGRLQLTPNQEQSNTGSHYQWHSMGAPGQKSPELYKLRCCLIH